MLRFPLGEEVRYCGWLVGGVGKTLLLKCKERIRGRPASQDCCRSLIFEALICSCIRLVIANLASLVINSTEPTG